MSNQQSTKKEVYKNTALISAVSILNIIMGIAKTKVAAVLIGPAGIGLIGLFNGILLNAGILAHFGIRIAGVKEVSGVEKDNKSDLSNVIFAIISFVSLLAMIVGIGLIVFNKQISQLVFSNTKYGAGIWIIAIGVLFQVLASAQDSILNGLQKIKSLSIARAFSTTLAVPIAIIVIVMGVQNMIAWYVISVPLVSVFLYYYYLRKHAKINWADISFSKVTEQYKVLFKLGFYVMLSGLVAKFLMMAVRVFIVQKTDEIALGFFQSAWSISELYIGFLFTAMMVDFYPRAVKTIGDIPAQNELLNNQFDISIKVSAPLILGMITFKSIVIILFYSSAFLPTVDILFWQLLGSIFKVVAIPIIYLMLAAGWNKAYLLMNILWQGLFFLIIYFGLEKYGIEITGIGYFASYFLYALVCIFIAFKKLHVKIQSRSFVHIAIITGFAISILLLSNYNIWLSYIFGGIVTAYYGINALQEINNIFPQLSKFFRK